MCENSKGINWFRLRTKRGNGGGVVRRVLFREFFHILFLRKVVRKHEGRETIDKFWEELVAVSRETRKNEAFARKQLPCQAVGWGSFPELPTRFGRRNFLSRSWNANLGSIDFLRQIFVSFPIWGSSGPVFHFGVNGKAKKKRKEKEMRFFFSFPSLFFVVRKAMSREVRPRLLINRTTGDTRSVGRPNREKKRGSAGNKNWRS